MNRTGKPERTFLQRMALSLFLKKHFINTKGSSSMKLIFATHNRHKVEEIQAAIGPSLEIITLDQANIHIDIPEPHDTLQDNASEKSKTIFQLTGMGCFSEDTGLEVEALNGEPGVRSARYAGEAATFDQNIDRLLSELGHNPNRNARFRTIISLLLDGKEYLFEGVCPGSILPERRGTAGFGYDPVFLPEGSSRSFAEMTMEEKNRYSHRKKAASKLVEFLKSCRAS
jgi:XTP/dITP diphosphohydrolase